MKRLICILAAAVLWTASVSAQQGTADMRGKVVDQQHAALPGVTLVVKHQASGLFRETVSGADGSFFLSAMTPGVYEVSAELAGFKKYQRRDVRLEVGGTAQLEVALEVGGIEEAVTVTGTAPLVDTTSQEIGGRITEQEFVGLKNDSRRSEAGSVNTGRPLRTDGRPSFQLVLSAGGSGGIQRSYLPLRMARAQAS